MEEVLLEHSSRYPAMALQDYVKLLYQSEFAGGHLIEDPAKSLAWLRKERADTPDRAQPKWEAIGGGLARLHIGALPPDTVWEAVNRLFVWTARGWNTNCSCSRRCVKRKPCRWKPDSVRHF